MFAHTLDLLLNEVDQRFASTNTKLWERMEALSPLSKDYLKADSLKLLLQYMSTALFLKGELLSKNLSVDDLEAVYKICSQVLKKHTLKRSNKGQIEITNVLNYMDSDHKDTAPVLNMLYRIEVTAGFSSTHV